MSTIALSRRKLIAVGGAVLATGVSALLLPASAQGLAPTRSMSGGSNNYRRVRRLWRRLEREASG